MRVVVVIPCYNVEAYVGQAINSALEQTFPVAKVVAVDNGSTDGTQAVLEAYQQSYPERFQWLSETRKGASIARNTGWRNTSADWYQFLDADDVLFSEKIERQIALAQKNEAQWVIGTPLYQHLDGTRRGLTPWEDPWQGLAHGMYVGQTSANLYAHNLLEQIGGWRDELPYTQDVDLAFRILKHESRFTLDQTLACIVRDRATGKLSQMNPAGILEQHVHLRWEVNQYLEQERTEYWSTHRTFFQLALYRYVRMLACHAPTLAAELFGRYLPKNFHLQPNSELGLPIWDAVGVNMLGLERFARMRNTGKAILPIHVWSALKRLISAKKEPPVQSQES